MIKIKPFHENQKLSNKRYKIQFDSLEYRILINYFTQTVKYFECH